MKLSIPRGHGGQRRWQTTQIIDQNEHKEKQVDRKDSWESEAGGREQQEELNTEQQCLGEGRTRYLLCCLCPLCVPCLHNHGKWGGEKVERRLKKPQLGLRSG
jgi:hypothetical protein